MTTPSLTLAVSAPGAAQIIALAESVQSLTNNLATLGKVTSGTDGLQRMAREFRAMRAELSTALNGIRVDLVEGFDKVAAQVNAGAEEVEREGKKGAVKVRAAIKGIAMGGDVSVSASGKGLGAVDALRAIQTQIKGTAAAIAAEMEAYTRQMLVAEGKQKALWVRHLQALQAQLNEERKMMDNAVAQFRAIQAKREADEIAFERKQKARWVQYRNELANRWAAEAHMMDGAVMKFRALQAAREAEAVRYQVRQATAFAVGPYTSITPGSFGIVKGLQETDTHARRATGSLQGLSKALNDGHSAARGLASGFGAMWLTWGNMLPLLAGAAVSHAFVQTIKQGAELQNTFTQIKVLASETAESVGMLSDKMFALARSSQFGPQEIANGMKLLTLAGLDAKEAYSAINDVLNFAVAGDMKIDKAADVMTTVATAFNVAAENYSYVADVIAKSAAESKSSVEGMGEAFKTASVIHQQYGASLEDVGVSLALLANAGIQNTAAGTALRNMYVDLAGRTPKVQKALDDLGIKTLDPITGKLRAQSLVIKELIEALGKLKPTEQFKAIQDIFSERGGKAGVAAMNAMMKTIRENGVEIGNVYDNLHRKISESAGFAAIAAAEMSLTPLNQMKATAATLQSVLVETFQSLQPVIIDLTYRLRELFRSEGFKDSLTELVTLVGNLTVLMVEHGKEIATVVLAYAGFRSVISIIQAVQAATTAWAAATTAGLTAIGTAARLATMANPLLQLLMALITAGAAGWSMYQMWLGKANDESGKFANGSENKALLERLEQEVERLDKVNEARARGITLMELEASIALEKAKAAPPVTGPLQKQLAEIDAKIAAEKTVPVENRTLYAWEQRANAGSRLKALEQERANLAQKIATSEAEQLETVKNLERIKLRLQAGTRQAADAARTRQAELNTPLQGTGVRPSGDVGGAGGLSIGDLKDENILADLRAVLEARLSTLTTAYRNEKALLDAKHSAGLVSEGVYQAQLLNMLIVSEEAQRMALSEEASKWAAEWQKPLSAVQNSKLATGDKAKAIKSLQSEWDKYFAKLHSQFKNFESGAFKQEESAIIKMRGETKKLVEANDEYWDKAEQGVAKDAKLAEQRERLATATEAERLSAEAVLKVTEKHQPAIDKLADKYAEAVKELADFNEGLDDTTRGTDQANAVFNHLVERVTMYEAALVKSRAQFEALKTLAAQAGIDQASANAAAKLRKDFEDGSKKIASDLADAILEGGKEGGAKLRNYLKDLFVRQPLKAVLEVMLKPVGNFMQSLVMTMAGGSGSGSLGSTLSNLFGGSGSGGSGLFSGPGLFGGSGSLSNSIFDTGFDLWANNDGFLSSVGDFMMESADTIGMIGDGLSYISAFTKALDGEWGSAAGTAIGTFFGGPLGGFLGGQLGSFVDDLFGGGGGPKVEGSFGDVGSNGVGVYGNQFDQQAMQTIQGLTQSFRDIAESLGVISTGFSFGLGISTDPEGDSPSFVQATTMRNGQRIAESLDLNVGRSEAELQKAIELATARSLLSALRASDLEGRLAEYFSQLDPVQMSAEEINVSVRLAQAANDVWKAFDKLGPAFASLASMSVQATASFIQFSGGLENMRASMASFYDNFYTEEQRRALTVTQISTTLTKAGISMSEQDVLNLVANPDARRLFREWVEANAAIGESASRTVAVLMSVSGALASLLPPVEAVTEAVEDTTDAFDEAAEKLKEIAAERLTLEKRMYEVQGKTYMVTALARAEYDASNVALFDYITNLEAAREAVNRALEAELKALDAKLAKEREAETFYKNLSESLRKYRDDLLQGDLSPLTPGQKYAEASNLFQTTYEAAIGGDKEAAGRLQSVAEAFLRASQVYNASGEQYQSDFARVASALTLQIAKADEASSYAAQQVTLLTEQRNYLQQQVDQLFGINNAIMSLAEAMGHYQAVYNSAPATTVQTLYQNLLGRAPDPEGEAYWNIRLAQGASVQDITYGFLNSPEFRSRISNMVSSGALYEAWTTLKSTGLTMAELNGGMGFASNQLEQWAISNNLPVFHSGTSYVPRTGLALLERGEAVLSRSSVGSEVSALLAELREMKQVMLAQIEANNAAHERSAQQIVSGTTAAQQRSKFEQRNAREAKAMA